MGEPSSTEPASRSDYVAIPFLPELDVKFTMEELVSIFLVVASVLSLILMVLHRLLICLLQNSFVKELLLKIEIHAEVLAMNQSVQRAWASDEQAGGAAGSGSQGYKRLGARGRGEMGSNASALILAEAKAVTSKADDQRKTTKPAKTDIISTPQKSRYPRGRAGVKVDKKGKATLVYPGDGVYEGEYVDGRKEGKGKFWYVEGSVYEGTWLNDEKHGRGKETYADGATYEGKFAEGTRHGHGMLTYANKDVYEGEWEYDIKQGEGTFRWAAGTVYEGEWQSGVMHGQGTYFFADGCTYQGQYADGKRHGRGVYRFLDGSFFEGEYREGVVEGRGTFTFADGSAEVGRWEDGQPVGEATRFAPDHRSAWRLFDGQITGPITLDLADVIAQMAFRPKAARLARAVRDQLAVVHLQEERSRFRQPMDRGTLDRVGGALRARAASPTPPGAGEQSPWSGVMEIVPKSTGKQRPAPPAGYSLPDRYRA